MAGCCHIQSLITALTGLFCWVTPTAGGCQTRRIRGAPKYLPRLSREVTDGCLGEAGNKFWDRWCVTYSCLEVALRAGRLVDHQYEPPSGRACADNQGLWTARRHSPLCSE